MNAPLTTAPSTPHLDTVCAVLTAAVSPTLRWTLRGWAEHMRLTRHQNHAANSWARHRDEFGSARDQAAALVVARCVDFGMTPDEAAELLVERIAAREAKLHLEARLTETKLAA